MYQNYTFYQNALNLRLNYLEALLNMGAVHKDLRHFIEAVALADQVILINPLLSEAWSNKGITLKELKRYDEAIAHYDKAIHLKPDYAESWSNKGVTLQKYLPAPEI